MKELLAKYDIPAPRYTSYPTVPYWDDSPSTEEWIASINKTLRDEGTTWSMYIHIPFCESLCTYCGCNTTITRNHKKEMPYVERLLKEWSFYLEKSPGLSEKPIKEMHLGGGTPTFLSPESLKNLIGTILKDCNIPEDFEGSIEVDPRRTTKEHLEVLYKLGFKRVSMGVQDFDEEVQRLVNRHQPEELTRSLTTAARKMGYTSVNYDLIYGLPRQDLTKIKEMVKKTLEHNPDRIALYSLAIVPWIKPTHRIFKEEDLPKGGDKRDLYELARKMLIEGGYVEIGMDHFALKSDSLFQSMDEGRLHRNFMGYAATRTDILLGLGVSSISETPYMFHQNEKKLPVFEREVDNGNIPTLRGHKLNEEDRKYRELILKLMTLWEVDLSEEDVKDLKTYLSSALEDELIVFDKNKIVVKEKGRPFIRNIAMGLDKRLRRNNPDRKVFSQSI